MTVSARSPLAVLAAALCAAASVCGPAFADAAPSAAETPPPPAPAVQPCASSDLALRQVGMGAGGGPGAVVTFALRNRGTAACRMPGGVGIRLFDAQGGALPLRFAPRTAMALLLTLAPGDEASFTVSYAPPYGSIECKPAARIEVLVPPQFEAVGAKTSVPACTGAVMVVSNLRPGVPVSVPSSSPADLVT